MTEAATMPETAAPARDLPARHGVPWLPEEEAQLYEAFTRGDSATEIARELERTRGGVRSHLQALGLVDEFGTRIETPPDFAPTAAALKRAAKQAEKAANGTARKLRRAPDLGEAQKPLEHNPAFDRAFELMMESERSLFVTGKAGTGKSTLLAHFRKQAKKNVVVLAPTGIAALHVGGQTIHSFFRFSIDVTPQKVATRRKVRNASLYRKIDTLVIDEVSMARADVIDCVDAFLRLHGPQPGAAFGGVQLVLIGDLYQLPPVVGAQEREVFAQAYETPYFFSAQAMRDFPLERIELDKVYRQKDDAFIGLLNRVRDACVTEGDLARLNARLQTGAGAAENKDDDGYAICLTATNARADEINRARLDALKGKLYACDAVVSGEFGREYYPAAPQLSFKIGAQVMMLNNDKDGRWVNGSLGVIEDMHSDIDGKDFVIVRLQGEDSSVAVFAHTWEVYRYALAEGQIQSESAGSFTQYPFRLAWAVTIHKSQGKTFRRVAIDIGAGAFAAGQVYVALSRCTTLEGITLKTPIQRRHIMTDARIAAFMGRAEERNDESGAGEEGAWAAPASAPDEERAPLPPPVSAAQNFFLRTTAQREAFAARLAQAMMRRESVEIEYLKGNEELTCLTISPRAMGLETHREKVFLGIRAVCAPDGVERLFSLDRILAVR